MDDRGLPVAGATVELDARRPGFEPVPARCTRPMSPVRSSFRLSATIPLFAFARRGFAEASVSLSTVDLEVRLVPGADRRVILREAEGQCTMEPPSMHSAVERIARRVVPTPEGVFELGSVPLAGPLTLTLRRSAQAAMTLTEEPSSERDWVIELPSPRTITGRVLGPTDRWRGLRRGGRPRDTPRPRDSSLTPRRVRAEQRFVPVTRTFTDAEGTFHLAWNGDPGEPVSLGGSSALVQPTRRAGPERVELDLGDVELLEGNALEGRAISPTGEPLPVS